MIRAFCIHLAWQPKIIDVEDNVDFDIRKIFESTARYG